MADLAHIDAVVLCGGLGKRLRPQIGADQKVMARIHGRPFLDLVLQDLQRQGLSRVILCTGFRAETVEGYYRDNNSGLRIEFSREPEPLGTGGAVKKAAPLIKSDPFFVLNGDSFCPADYGKMLDFHVSKKAVCTVLLSRAPDPKDYGSVAMDAGKRLTAFQEKVPDRKGGDVNSGVYCFSREIFSFMPAAETFSLEKDFFPVMIPRDCYGFVTDQEFVDIGTPERYIQAKKIFGKAE